MLSENIYTGAFETGTAVSTILSTVIQAAAAKTKVNWNAAKVDVGSAPPQLYIEYIDEQISDIVDNLVGLCGVNYFWGVDANRDFYVKKYDEDIDLDLAYKYYNKDIAEFEKSTIKEDYSNIEMTEAIVYLNEPTTGVAMRCGVS